MNYVKLKDDIIDWVKNWFNQNGEKCNAVVGVSGGMKSTIALGVLCEALGKERVIGVIMRDDKEQSLDNDAIYVCKHFEVPYFRLPIYPSVNALKNLINLECKIKIKEQAVTNLPARMRMTALYAMSQSLNGRVVNTSCLSDNYIGNVTLWGDSCGDLSPFGLITCTELRNVGLTLRIPFKMIYVEADDKLPASKPDEEKYGFSYEILDEYIRNGEIKYSLLGNHVPGDINVIKQKIDNLHNSNKFKSYIMDTFNPELHIHIPE